METIKFKGKEYTVLKRLASKKLHVKYHDKDYIIVPFDTIDAFNKYLVNKKLLKKNKVEMAKVLKKDKKALLVLEQFIQGEDLASIIATNRLDDLCYKELFRVYRNNRFAQILLNYTPENFVKRKKYFYYVSDTVIPFTDGIAFERSKEMLLWLSTDEQKQYILSKGYKYLDRPLLNSSAEVKKKIALICVNYW